jgi:hypothetical protein
MSVPGELANNWPDLLSNAENFVWGGISLVCMITGLLVHHSFATRYMWPNVSTCAFLFFGVPLPFAAYFVPVLPQLKPPLPRLITDTQRFPIEVAILLSCIWVFSIWGAITAFCCPQSTAQALNEQQKEEATQAARDLAKAQQVHINLAEPLLKESEERGVARQETMTVCCTTIKAQPVRVRPEVNALKVRSLTSKDVVTVTELRMVKGSIWARLGPTEWVQASNAAGDRFLEGLEQASSGQLQPSAEEFE